MTRKEKKQKEEELLLSQYEALRKASQDYMNVTPDSEEFIKAKDAFTQVSDSIERSFIETKKIDWDKVKVLLSLSVRIIETLGVLAFSVIFCGYEATNSMTSKLWPIISKKIAQLGLYSVSNI